MAPYIDGFVFPLPRAHLAAYQRLARAAAEIWKDHGALDYREYVADDLEREGTHSFREALATRDAEVIIFGWVAFSSREARDRANERVANDPRMAELMASADTGFDAERMAYAGFQDLLGARPTADPQPDRDRTP